MAAAGTERNLVIPTIGGVVYVGYTHLEREENRKGIGIRQRIKDYFCSVRSMKVRVAIDFAVHSATNVNRMATIYIYQASP